MVSSEDLAGERSCAVLVVSWCVAELGVVISVCVRVLRAATGREVRAPVDGVRVRLAMRGHADRVMGRGFL